MNSLTNIGDAQTLAQAIVNTIPEPFLVLDEQFSVLAASRSFYQTFGVEPARTLGVTLYALGDGQWDIPALRVLLETIIPERTAMDGFEVEHDFPGVGQRTMLLNAQGSLRRQRDNHDPAGLS
jgi:PAS domain-containing protein